MNLANFRLFLLAYTFGKTSPKSNIKKVTTITSKINFIKGEETDENKSLPIQENNITTPIFIKLLATSNVANNFLGFSKSEMIKFDLDKSCFETSSKSLVDKEKKATSAPESNADIKSKTKIPIKPNSKLVSKF